MCPYCFAANGEHKPGCSAPANVIPFPRKLLLKITNLSVHHLAVRETGEPRVYEIICACGEQRRAAADLLVIKSLVSDERNDGAHLDG